MSRKRRKLEGERWEKRRLEGEEFSDLELVGCSFHACVFLYAAGSSLGATIFDEVDLSDTEMRNVMFYGADLSSVVLPTESVQVVPNPDGAFARDLVRAAQSAPDDARIALRVLAGVDQGLRRTRDPMVSCEDVLASLLTTASAREILDRVAGRRARS